MKTFFEKQILLRGPLKFIHLLFFGLLLLLFYADFTQIVAGKPFGDKPASNLQLFALTSLIAIVYILFIKTALVTWIDVEGIKLKWVPYHKNYKLIKWAEIKEYTIINNHSHKVGYTRINNRVVNDVWGETALRLLLNDKREFFIGTQKGNEMESCFLNIQDVISNLETKSVS